jgi:hypothetical protein
MVFRDVLARFLKIQWFQCRQLDLIAETMGVSFRNPKHFGFLQKKDNRKATTNVLFRFVLFNRTIVEKTPVIACSIAAHEIQHFKNRFSTDKARARIFGFSIPVALLSAALIGFAIFQLLSHAIGILVPFPFFFVFLYFLSHGQSWRLWNAEFDCDEMSLKYLGLEPTLQFLKILNTKKKWRFIETHPAPSDRIKRVMEKSKDYPIPVLDLSKMLEDGHLSFEPLNKS